MFFVSLCSGLCICTCRYLCCCIRGGTCGKRYPTFKTKYLGYEQDPVTGIIAYSPKQRWFARIYMWIFVAFIFIWCGLGYFNGTIQVKINQLHIVEKYTFNSG